MFTYTLTKSIDGKNHRVTFTHKKSGIIVFKSFKLNYCHVTESTQKLSKPAASKLWRELINQGYQER